MAALWAVNGTAVVAESLEYGVILSVLDNV